MLFRSRFNVLTTRLPDPNHCLGTDVICAPEHSTLIAERSCTHEQPTGSGRWQLSTSLVCSVVGDGETDVFVSATYEADETRTAKHNSFNISTAIVTDHRARGSHKLFKQVSQCVNSISPKPLAVDCCMSADHRPQMDTSAARTRRQWRLCSSSPRCMQWNR